VTEELFRAGEPALLALCCAFHVHALCGLTRCARAQMFSKPPPKARVHSVMRLHTATSGAEALR